MERLQVKEPDLPNPGKPDVVSEIISILKKVLKYCLCCVTCGCYPCTSNSLHGEVYETELTNEEQQAVESLLNYLDSEGAKRPTINADRLRALCVLTYSDNSELQRSASLFYVDISEKCKACITEEELEPLVVLLDSRDLQVQKASSLAISNFAVHGPEQNKESIVQSGALPILIHLMSSTSAEVQCNACGCVTTLSASDEYKEAIITEGGLAPILTLASSKDIRVKRNATGALLNMSHLDVYREELVQEGALPVLVSELHASDREIQYYCAATLSNLAVLEKHRTMLVAIGHYDVIRRLVKLITSSTEKVRCQACLALRNIASDSDNQVLIVKLKGLAALYKVITHSHGETLTAALACLRNLSIHTANEASIVSEKFLQELKHLVMVHGNAEAQRHSVGTLRNLAGGEHIQELNDSGCTAALFNLLIDPSTLFPVLIEVTAALAMLSDEDSVKQQIVDYKAGHIFSSVVALASATTNTELQYNCMGIIGQVALLDLPSDLVHENSKGLQNCLEQCLRMEQTTFVHVALWTSLQLLKDESLLRTFQEAGLHALIEDIALSEGHTTAVRQLAQSALQKITEG